MTQTFTCNIMFVSKETCRLLISIEESAVFLAVDIPKILLQRNCEINF